MPPTLLVPPAVEVLTCFNFLVGVIVKTPLEIGVTRPELRVALGDFSSGKKIHVINTRLAVVLSARVSKGGA